MLVCVFVVEGVWVVLLDWWIDGFDDLVMELGGGVFVLVCDMFDVGDIVCVVIWFEVMGGVDILINNVVILCFGFLDSVSVVDWFVML